MSKTSSRPTRAHPDYEFVRDNVGALLSQIRDSIDNDSQGLDTDLNETALSLLETAVRVIATHHYHALWKRAEARQATIALVGLHEVLAEEMENIADKGLDAQPKAGTKKRR